MAWAGKQVKRAGRTGPASSGLANLLAAGSLQAVAGPNCAHHEQLLGFRPLHSF